MRRTFAAVALAILLALSGCSALPFGGGGGGLTADQAPPGVDAENGTFADSAALLDAHTETLLKTGFTYRFSTNATVVQEGQRRRVSRSQLTQGAPNATEYGFRTRNPGSQIDAWGNESVQAVRFRFGDRVVYRQAQPIPAEQLTGESVFGRYLSAGGWNVTNVTEREDTTDLVTLTSTTEPANPRALPDNATDLRDYEAHVVVDSEGRIYEFSASGTYTIDGSQGSFAIAYTLRSLEDPGVTRPQWVPEALS
ncbi:hypothetical protein [Halorarius halobius]|uniref:hypothetical protein n=1 Tax=Halorarius halobius TaxID=2962671 RepID=UPI0020CE5B01|nr:hypothetical protein [Halorarius halobius]